MTGPFEVWRQRLWLWIPALAFCVINLLVFGYYRGSLAGGVESLEANYQRDQETLRGLEQERRRVEAFLDYEQRNREGIETLYDERFATEEERFTRVLEETRKLARQAGLEPTSYSYPEERFEDYGLIKRDINFSVVASYEQLRQFINLLELSDEFLTLEGVSLSGRGTDVRNPQLNIRFTISTIFRTQLAAAARAQEGVS